jgi:hypothetical protein
MANLAYYQLPKFGVCHQVVDLALELATQLAPERPWRIITSAAHSTVWDGDQLLLDLIFPALQIPPEECFKLAYQHELQPGQRLPMTLFHRYVGFSTKFIFEVKNNVRLSLGKPVALADGWWISSDESEPVGPFANDRAALAALGEASSESMAIYLDRFPPAVQQPDVS